MTNILSYIETHTKDLAISFALLLAALLSATFITEAAVNPANHADTIQSIEQKITDVMELTAVSTGASVAVTALPGDLATPVADKLADFSTYFLIVLCALYLEKFLLTIIGYASFRVLIPLACALLIVYRFRKKQMLPQLAYRMIGIALAIFIVIPLSIKIADIVDENSNFSVQSSIEKTQNTVDELQGYEVSTDQTGGESTGSGSGNIISNFLNQASDSLTEKMDQFKSLITNFVNVLAVLLVTSCLIPILVLLFFIWLIKAILQLDFALYKKKREEK